MQALVFFFLLLFSTHGYSQANTESEFLGTLQLSDNTIISYKLTFRELPDGKIEGQTITDFQGPDKTVSTIKGSISADRSTISFSEVDNLSSKSKADASDFCYVHLEKARIKKIKGKTIIYGKFKGKKNNGKKCIDGYVYLISAQYLDELAGKLSNNEKYKNNDTVKQLLHTYNSVVKKANDNQLTGNDELGVNWKSNDLIIDIWDSKNQDGDEITLYVNGSIVLDKFVITQTKKSIILPSQSKSMVLKILAASEGSSPPCTVNILIRGENDYYPLNTVLKKGEFAVVRLTKN